MKKVLLFVSTAILLTSCATRKYGCGYTSDVKDTSKTFTHLEIHPYKNKDGVLMKDTIGITQKYHNGRLITVGCKNYSYKPNVSLCRAYGKVVLLDTFSLPKKYLVKIGGILLRDDTVVTEVKYLIVPESNFYKALHPYVNTNKDVYFEAFAVFPNIYDGPDVQYSVSGCIESVVEDTNYYRNDLIFIKGK